MNINDRVLNHLTHRDVFNNYLTRDVQMKIRILVRDGVIGDDLQISNLRRYIKVDLYNTYFDTVS